MTRSRVYDGALLVVSIAVMILSARPFTGLLVDAWSVESSVVAAAVTGFLSAIGATLASAIAFTTGLLGVFILLFLFDSSKKVQALVFVLALPLFFTTLNRSDLWMIPWTRELIPLAVGVVVALPIGTVGARVDTESDGAIPRVREFPAATRAIYWIVVVSVLVALVQVHVLAGQPGIVLNVVLSGAIVALTAVFTTYQDDRSVLIISPDPYEEANVLGGIYQEARSRFGAEAINEGSSIATEDVSALGRARKLTAPDLDLDQSSGMTVAAAAKEHLVEIRGDAGFRFRAPGVFGRTLEIIAHGYGPDDIRREDLDALDDNGQSSHFGSLRRRVVDFAGFVLPAMLPAFVRERVTGGPTKSVGEAIRDADILLLVAPLDDQVAEGAATQDAGDRSTVLGKYDAICGSDAVKEKTVRMVVTDSHRLKDEFEEKRNASTNSPPSKYLRRFGRFLNQTRLGNTCCEVVPVFRVLNSEREMDTRLWGASELLEEVY